jgi:hypothetical protein
MLVDVDEPDWAFRRWPRWQWILGTRSVEVELINQQRNGNPTPSVELWQVTVARGFSGGVELCYVTEATLDFPSIAQPGGGSVSFYRVRSHRALIEARRDYEMLTRAIKQQLRPLA